MAEAPLLVEQVHRDASDRQLKAWLLEHTDDVDGEARLHRQLTVAQVAEVDPLIDHDVVREVHVRGDSSVDELLSAVVEVAVDSNLQRRQIADREPEDIFIVLDNPQPVSEVAPRVLNRLEVLLLIFYECIPESLAAGRRRLVVIGDLLEVGLLPKGDDLVIVLFLLPESAVSLALTHLGEPLLVCLILLCVDRRLQEPRKPPVPLLLGMVICVLGRGVVLATVLTPLPFLLHMAHLRRVQLHAGHYRLDIVGGDHLPDLVEDLGDALNADNLETEPEAALAALDDNLLVVAHSGSALVLEAVPRETDLLLLDGHVDPVHVRLVSLRQSIVDVESRLVLEAGSGRLEFFLALLQLLALGLEVGHWAVPQILGTLIFEKRLEVDLVLLRRVLVLLELFPDLLFGDGVIGRRFRFQFGPPGLLVLSVRLHLTVG